MNDNRDGNEIIVTVFTPTYNRGYIIEKLFTSLKRQTNFMFEWLVIDDGSTDNTCDLFMQWQREEISFPIRYHKIENGGKHRAINKAVLMAHGRLFFIVDSDDYLTDDAIEKLILWESTLPNNGVFAGISGNRGYSHDKIIGSTFEGESIDATYTQREEYGIEGDKAEAYYTYVLREYPFPEFAGENFLTERVVWDKIGAEGLKIRWMNDIIYIGDYLEDGLSKGGINIYQKNPKGIAYNLVQMTEIYHYTFLQRLREYNSYYELVREYLSFSSICENLKISKSVLLLSIGMARCYRFLKYGRWKNE